MPAIVTTEYVDDLDGVSVDVKNVDTVEFSYRGTSYTLVLTKANGSEFDKHMQRYIKAAKKAQAQVARVARDKATAGSRKSGVSSEAKAAPVKTVAPRKAAPTRKSYASRQALENKVDKVPDGAGRAKAIREWAAANGHTVSARGRISASVVEAFDAAQ